MKRKRIASLVAILLLLSVFSNFPSAALAENTDHEQDYRELILSELNGKLKNEDAEFVFGRVLENHYRNRNFDLQASMTDNWFMSDAYLRASRADKEISDLLDEVDNGDSSVTGLSAMNIGLKEALSAYEMLNIEVLNSPAMYGNDLEIEDYVSLMKQNLPSEVMEFRQEKYAFAGEDYYSLFYTFSEDAPIQYERVVFAKAGDYIAQIQMMASDRDVIETTLENFGALTEEIPQPEEADNTPVSAETEEPRELADPDLEAYEPVVKDVLNEADNPQSSFGMLDDIDGDGIDDLFMLYVVDGIFRFSIIENNNGQPSTRFSRSNSAIPADQGMLGSGLFNGNPVVIVYIFSVTDSGFSEEYQVLDAVTFDRITSVKSEIWLSSSGAIIVPHGNYYIDSDQVSEDRYLDVLNSIEIKKALYSSSAVGSDFHRQQLLQDVLYESSQDSTERKEEAQLEIFGNRINRAVDDGSHTGNPSSGMDVFQMIESILSGFGPEIPVYDSFADPYYDPYSKAYDPYSYAFK